MPVVAMAYIRAVADRAARNYAHCRSHETAPERRGARPRDASQSNRTAECETRRLFPADRGEATDAVRPSTAGEPAVPGPPSRTGEIERFGKKDVHRPFAEKPKRRSGGATMLVAPSWSTLRHGRVDTRCDRRVEPSCRPGGAARPAIPPVARPEGLSDREAERRLLAYGPNELGAAVGAAGRDLLDQFTHPLALLLWVAAALAVRAGSPSWAARSSR